MCGVLGGYGGEKSEVFVASGASVVVLNLPTYIIFHLNYLIYSVHPSNPPYLRITTRASCCKTRSVIWLCVGMHDMSCDLYASRSHITRDVQDGKSSEMVQKQKMGDEEISVSVGEAKIVRGLVEISDRGWIS